MLRKIAPAFAAIVAFGISAVATAQYDQSVQDCIDLHPNTLHSHGGGTAEWGLYEVDDSYTSPVYFTSESGPDEEILKSWLFPNATCHPIHVSGNYSESTTHHVHVGILTGVQSETEAEVKAAVFASIKAKVQAKVEVDSDYSNSKDVVFAVTVSFDVEPGDVERLQIKIYSNTAVGNKDVTPAVVRCWSVQSQQFDTTVCGSIQTVTGDGRGTTGETSCHVEWVAECKITDPDCSTGGGGQVED